MKAFVAVTLLAACVAAQTFDHQTGLRQLLKRENGVTGLNGILKDVFRIGKDITFDTVPTTFNTYNTVNGVNILSLDDLIRHPLFQLYKTLPLFREHFTHPLFQVYLTTPYFQSLWKNVEVFPIFFKSQFLFNKYIFPVVYNTVPTTGVTVDREINLDVNTKNIFGQTVFPLNVNHVQYIQGMDKIIETLINKPEILEVLADLKTQTPVEEHTFVKVVDPITGEIKYTVGDYKNVEKTVLPVDQLKTINDIELIKNAILKKIFLNKVIYGDRVIPEIYNLNKESIMPRDVNTVYQRDIINKILGRDIVNKYETYPRELTNTVYPRELINTVYPRELINTVYPRELTNTNTVYPRDISTVYQRDIISKIFGRDLVNKHESIYPTVFPRQLVNTVYPREFVNTVYPRELVNTVYPRELVNKVDSVYPRELVNTVYPRELVNKVDSVYPRELVNTVKYETILPRELIQKYQTILPTEFLENYKTLVNKYEKVLPHVVNDINAVLPKELIQKFATVLPAEFLNHYNTLINKFETTTLPRDLLINKVETENKLENILKSVVV